MDKAPEQRDEAPRAGPEAQTPYASDELFRLLVESVKHYAIFVLDPAGRVISWNAGAENIKGYRADEILGRHFSVFYTAEDVARGLPAELLQHAMTEGRVENEGPRVRKDGSVFWADVVITALRGSDGTLRGFAKVTRDMTERRAAEDALRRAKEEAEAASRELEAFSYSVSHDLRAPLRSIDGFSQALVEDYQDKLDATGVDYLGRVRANAQRMSQLIDALLKLSRVTRSEMRRDEVDLSAVAAAVVAELSRTQPERKVAVTIQSGLRAVGDAHLLRLALENLLGNAWKFTAKRADAAIEVGATETEGERVFFVRDNGAGFDMAYADKLFGAFQRMHHTTEFPGTGIGLATVQRIVHRHRGRIWAEAAPDQGATFFFTLPCQSSGGSG